MFVLSPGSTILFDLIFICQGGREVRHVTGTFTIPHISAVQGTASSVLFSLAIDGHDCRRNSVKLGVGFESPAPGETYSLFGERHRTSTPNLSFVH